MPRKKKPLLTMPSKRKRKEAAASSSPSPHPSAKAKKLKRTQGRRIEEAQKSSTSADTLNESGASGGGCGSDGEAEVQSIGEQERRSEEAQRSSGRDDGGRKKRGAGRGTKASKLEKSSSASGGDDEVEPRFVGGQVPPREARQRWPKRYQIKEVSSGTIVLASSCLANRSLKLLAISFRSRFSETKLYFKTRIVEFGSARVIHDLCRDVFVALKECD